MTRRMTIKGSGNRSGFVRRGKAVVAVVVPGLNVIPRWWVSLYADMY
jgi:hypothetical protein